MLAPGQYYASFYVELDAFDYLWHWQESAIDLGTGHWTGTNLFPQVRALNDWLLPTGTVAVDIFGEAVATPPTCGTADFNGDGDVGTDQDIEAFFACLGGHCCPACGTADFNNDGDVGTDQDIESFFRVLGGGPC